MFLFLQISYRIWIRRRKKRYHFQRPQRLDIFINIQIYFIKVSLLFRYQYLFVSSWLGKLLAMRNVVFPLLNRQFWLRWLLIIKDVFQIEIEKRRFFFLYAAVLKSSICLLRWKRFSSHNSGRNKMISFFLKYRR